MARNQVVLWHEGEESSAAESVSGVTGLDVQVLHAFAKLDIFCTAGVFSVKFRNSES